MKGTGGCELPRPEGRGFQRLEVALRHSPSFAGSRGSHLRHPMHLINAWAIVACLTSPNTGFRDHRSLEHPLRFLTKYRVKNFSRPPRHPLSERRGFQL